MSSIDSIIEILLKGRRANVGEVRTWSDGRKYMKHPDGWVSVGGPNHGKLLGQSKGEARYKDFANDAKAKMEGGKDVETKPKTDSQPRADSKAGEKKDAAPKDPEVPKSPDPKPATEPTAEPATQGDTKPSPSREELQRQPKKTEANPAGSKPDYSISELTRDVLTNREGKRFRGFSTGLPSKVPYRSPEGTDTNMIGYVAFGKASVAAQEKLNRKLQNCEIVLSDLGIRFKTPVDFVCQSMKATANEAASYNNMSNYDVNHRIDIRHDTAIQKSLLHEIGHAIDFSTGPTDAGGRNEYLSHAVLEGDRFEELKGDLDALMDSALESPYYKESRTGKFGKYLREKTEVFARGFEVLAYKRTKDLVEAGKLQPEALEDFTPDLIKAAKSDVPKNVEDMDPELKKLTEERAPIRAEMDKLYKEFYKLSEEARTEPSKQAEAAKVLDRFRTMQSKILRIDKKIKPLRRKAQSKVRANVSLQDADDVVERIAKVMEGILSKTEFRKAMLEVDLVGSLVDKLNKSKWLDVGIKVEMEHTKDMDQARKIAQDHLDEDPDYYKDWDAKEKILFQEKAPAMNKSEPVNRKLYERVKSAAKKKFDVYPSAYANAWLVQEYKKRGGTYKSEPSDNDLEKGLDDWFNEQWVDIGRKDKDGKHPECGRSDADKGKYPKCVPKAKASSMSDDEKRSAVQRKRRAESTQERKEGKPINVATKVEKSEGEKKPLNKPIRDTSGGKKFKVHVKDPQTGNTKTVRFGDANMEIKRDDPNRRSNFRARHNCDDPGPKTKARYWSCRTWTKKPVSDVVKSLEDILKSKTVTKDGKQYYAEGPNTGKEVGTVRGGGQEKPQSLQKPTSGSDRSEASPKAGGDQVKAVETKAVGILETFSNEKNVKGRKLASGKPVALTVEAATEAGYTPEDLTEATDYHMEQAERVAAFIQSNGVQSPVLTKLKDKYRQTALAMNAQRVRIEERRKKTQMDQRTKKEDKVEKAMTEMAHLDQRSIDTGSYAKDREEQLRSGWLERLYQSMEGFRYGDLPREIGLDKGTLYLVKVDEGMYTGFVKLRKQVMNEDTGAMEDMEDTAKVRLERMALAEIPTFLMAKEFISPLPPQMEEAVDPEPTSEDDYLEAKLEEMSDAIVDLQEAPMNPILNQRIRILELIAKLTS